MFNSSTSELIYELQIDAKCQLHYPKQVSAASLDRRVQRRALNLEQDIILGALYNLSEHRACQNLLTVESATMSFCCCCKWNKMRCAISIGRSFIRRGCKLAKKSGTTIKDCKTTNHVYWLYKFFIPISNLDVEK
jgi:hypothetical protein